jgi:F0F1-type ATP synthase delta subunit
MVSIRTLSRPYAKAAYEVAKKRKTSRSLAAIFSVYF